MKIKVGIDASRNRSGGSKAHIIGIITELELLPDEIKEVHVWSYKALLDILPNTSWLIKHSPPILEKSLIHQLWWQYKRLPLEAASACVDILLNTDAGSVCRYHPAVTMSRDMLSYEKGEIQRFGFGFARLRLYVLRYVQNYSLKKSDGAIFLTEYASQVIQRYCGKISNSIIIPHGVSKAFRIESNLGIWNKKEGEPIRCIYVSNVALYKHQWNIVKAIKHLRQQGHNLSVTFVGGGEGKAQRRFEKELLIADPEKKFTTQLEFVRHAEIPDLLKDSDVFIFASSCENMPNTLIEGMSSGLPIACSNRGPMPEVLQDGGIYFDPENYITIAQAIETIINMEANRLTISKRAKELSQQYNWSKCAQETFNYLVNTYKNMKK
ncbi:MAG: glycosyltransferase family 1 protein [Ferruginibacter sp.]